MKFVPTIIGGATLYNGDCLELLAHGLLAADAIVSDPPYGIGFKQGNTYRTFNGRHVSRHGDRIIGDDVPFDPSPWLGYRAVLLFGADHYRSRLPPEGGEWLTWDKSVGQGAATLHRDAEYMWCNHKSPRNIFWHLWKGAIREGEEAPHRQNRLHVSQKPVALMIWCMKIARIGIGKTVLDPYMGSGSTGIAALITGRKFVGVEIDPDIFATACQRLRGEVEDGPLE